MKIAIQAIMLLVFLFSQFVVASLEPNLKNVSPNLNVQDEISQNKQYFLYKKKVQSIGAISEIEKGIYLASSQIVSHFTELDELAKSLNIHDKSLKVFEFLNSGDFLNIVVLSNRSADEINFALYNFFSNVEIKLSKELIVNLSGISLFKESYKIFEENTKCLRYLRSRHESRVFYNQAISIEKLKTAILVESKLSDIILHHFQNTSNNCYFLDGKKGGGG